MIRTYTELMLSNARSETVNVCSGNAISINDILTAVSNIAGYKIKVKVNPKFVRPNEIRVLKGSIKKMTNIVGDFTNEFNIKNTLNKMYRS